LDNFFSELKRRNVVRVAIAYVIVAWVVLQFVELVSDIMNIPDVLPQVMLIVLVAGFPIVLIISWAFEVTPEGVKKTAEVDASKSVTHGTGQKINYLIIGGLLIAVGFLLYERNGAPDPLVGPASAGTVSIAVLPFADLSPESNQEYFSDGMTEEILNVLVKVPDLKVAGRTSSFAFKGRNEDLREIGKQLDVNFIVEGSVRKSGNQLRITAQLIRASDGFHLWSETYDRELTEIFEVQDEISRAIADALSISLGIENINLVPNQTKDLIAYEEYLKALSLYKARGPGLGEAIDLLNTVTLRDPNYASAWALLARVYAVLPFWVPDNGQNELWDRNMTLAELVAKRALELDPNSAVAYSALASAFSERRIWVKALEYHQKAIELDPTNGDIHQQYAEVLGWTGQFKKAIEIIDRAVELEPLSAIILNAKGYISIDSGADEAGLEALKKAFVLDPSIVYAINSILFYYFDLGKFDEAYAFAKLVNQHNPQYSEKIVPFTKMIMDGASEAEVRVFIADAQNLFLFKMTNVAFKNKEAILGDTKRFVFDEFYFSNPRIMGRPYRLVWDDPRFKELVRLAGLYSYWKTGNWADDCAPVGDDDFECTP